MKLTGLTGGIASGKSTVSQIFQDLGAEIIDADLLARKVVEPGRWAWKRIVAHFGKEILLPNKQVDRERLGAVIFADKAERRYLNSVTHPPIYIEFLKEFIYIFIKRPPMIILDAALLLESPLSKLTKQRVIVVYTDKDTQLERLMKRDGISREAALQRINSQMSMEERRSLADYVIDNSGTVKETEKQVYELWAKLANLK